MCIFFPDVEDVANTNIFARFIKNNKQLIAYQMDYQSQNPVAMILPIPVEQSENNESAIDFINLDHHQNLFKELYIPFQRYGLGTRSLANDDIVDSLSLKIHKVGNFDASYSPSLEDLNRLDPKFGMDISIWNEIPKYKDYGFVIFKLSSGSLKPHPMAFTFPSRMKDLFFPTVHIHDGKIHEKEKFDHRLYAQQDIAKNNIRCKPWQTSNENAGNYLSDDKVVDLDKKIRFLELKGIYKNDDITLEV